VSGPDVTVWYNPRCSKCVGAEELLDAYGVKANYIHYLDEPPSREEIEQVLRLLGSTNPRSMMRIREPVYAQLNLAAAGRDTLIQAMIDHPILIERPVVIWSDRAVIARPPELLLVLLSGPDA
jgi:arsenate reductase (glutaredoxin)